MHLQHQVRATLEIKSQVNAVLKRLLQPTMRNPKDSIREDQKDCDDKACSTGQILAHCYLVSFNACIERVCTSRASADYALLLSSSVVTAATALFTNSSFTPSGAVRTTSKSSFTLTITPRIPPFVVTRSPGFSAASIAAHVFCFRWFGAISRKYIATNINSSSGIPPNWPKIPAPLPASIAIPKTFTATSCLRAERTKLFAGRVFLRKLGIFRSPIQQALELCGAPGNVQTHAHESQ